MSACVPAGIDINVPAGQACPAVLDGGVLVPERTALVSMKAGRAAVVQQASQSNVQLLV